MTHSADPTKHKEYQEQRARFDKRQAAGHWTGKSKAQREREKKARKKKKAKTTVQRGIEKAAGTGRELDKYIKMLGGK